MSIEHMQFGLAGQVDVNPRRNQLTVTDNFAAITTPGYLTEMGISPFSVAPTDIFDVTYSFNKATGSGRYAQFYCSNSSTGSITLIPMLTNQVESFTARLLFGGLSTGITTSSNQADFSINGTILDFTIAMVLTSKGSATGAATIVGMPYFAGGRLCQVYSQAVTWTGSQIVGVITSGYPSSLALIGMANTGVDVALTDSNFSNTSSLNITGSYNFGLPY